MGIDCPDIHRIMHWGLPSDVEEYVQVELDEMGNKQKLFCLKERKDNMQVKR